MPRTTRRRKLARGIYSDGARSVEIELMVNGVRLSERHPADTDLAQLIDRRERLKAEATIALPRLPSKGTLAGDAPTYLSLIRHLHQTTQRSRKAHLAAWCAAGTLGSLPRHRITSHHVLAARADWLAAKLSPKTVNHRVDTLRRLYRTLDGQKAYTPCDDVQNLPVHRTPIQRVSPEVILAVHRKLAESDKCTHARYCVLVSTGKRPSELMRAQKGDVDLEARVWVPRDGKGGWSPGLYLNDDMLAAWTLFIAANAWGDFSTSLYAKRLRRAGWPTGVRPYNARHSLLIALVEAGADMADVQVQAGHKSLVTTRGTYTGILGSRVQRTSELLDGRLGGFVTVPRSGAGESEP